MLMHNKVELSKACYDSVRRTAGDPSRYEFILTDNASTDGTLEWLGTLTDLQVWRNDKNIGFGIPHNEAFRKSGGDFFVVLNNDIVFLEEGWLDKMKAQFDADPRLAICGVTGTCSEIGPDGTGRPGKLDYVEASIMMVRATFAREHGLFDKAYRFIYCEDADFSLRARALGWKLAAIPLKYTHDRSATVKAAAATVDFDGYKIRNRHILLGRLPRYMDALKPQTFLIRRTGARGDVLMATPAIAALKEAKPSLGITVATDFPDILRGNPDVDAVTGTKHLPNGVPVINLDMTYEREPMNHPAQVYAKVLGVTLRPDARLRLYPSADEKACAATTIKDGAKVAIVHAGPIPGWVGRVWKGRWDLVAAGLRDRGYEVVAVRPDKNFPVPWSSRSLDGLSCGSLTAVMEKASLFVGSDSFPFHIAQAVEIPTVGIFGSIDPDLRIFTRHPERVVAVVAENVGCLGCHQYQSAPRTSTVVCLRKHEMCMERLRPEDILAGVDQVTKGAG